MGFKTKVVAPAKEGRGKLLENGSWTGIVGMLQRYRYNF